MLDYVHTELKIGENNNRFSLTYGHCRFELVLKPETQNVQF